MDRRAAVLVLGVAALAAGCSSGHAQRGTVPWANRPLPLYSAPQPRLISYPTTAPACRAAQLRVSQGRNGVAAGSLGEEFVFTNTGAAPCLLRGSPTVSGAAPDGRRVALRPRRVGGLRGQLSPADLAPGGRVFLDFGTSDCGCTCVRPHPTRYRHLVFRLPRGGSVPGGRLTLVVDCWLEMSRFGLPEQYGEPHARPGTVGTLRARVRAPQTARAGTVLHYSIELVNPSNRAVELSPCPGYTESVYTPTAHVSRSFRLDCDSVHSIRPHGRTRYAMELAIPRHASGTAKLGWSLDTPTGRSAGSVAIVEILAA
jgi:uncharacterized protein DUF4232